MKVSGLFVYLRDTHTLNSSSSIIFLWNVSDYSAFLRQLKKSSNKNIQGQIFRHTGAEKFNIQSQNKEREGEKQNSILNS